MNRTTGIVAGLVAAFVALAAYLWWTGVFDGFLKPEEQTASNEVPEELRGNGSPVPADAAQDTNATPMDERVATLGLLNKRNNLTRDIEIKPGESRRIGDVVIKLQACEKTAPWETTPEMGAFVQLFVNQRSSRSEPLRWHKVFSGWLFKNSPSLNVVEHPIYDVWIKNCEMRFPGEEESDPAPDSTGATTRPNASSNEQSGGATGNSPEPAPAAPSEAAPAE